MMYILSPKIFLSIFIIGNFWIASPSTVNAVDPIKGEKDFKRRCKSCHSVETGEHKHGPSLHNIIEATIGAREGYTYSVDYETARARGLIWKEVEMIKYFRNPAKYLENVLGVERSSTRMKQRISSEIIRTNIAAYLSSISN